MSADDRLADGHVFGRYRIVRLVGEGGMGAVYEAIHTTLKRRVAIKTLLPAHSQKEEARARFLREAEAASSISHPNVVTVSDVGIEGELPFMVMELLEGQTLGDLLAERGALEVEVAVGLLLPVIAAVAAGHDKGVIHRDLKPHNIFLARGRHGDLVPKVLDFGVSKVTGDDNALLTKTMTVLGTAAYMSPEQARGAKRVDFRSDQYALGLILYEMLTGTRAHPGDSALEVLHNVAMGLIKPAREIKPDLPNDLDSVLSRMLATNSAERYPSLYDAGRALLRFADEKSRLALASEFPAAASVAAPPAMNVSAEASAKPAHLESTDPFPGIRMGRTRVLPVSGHDPLSDTTLRHAAGEVATVDVIKPRRRMSARIGVALFGAIGFIVVATGVVLTSNNAPKTRAASSAASPPPASAIPFAIRAIPPEAEIVLDDRPPVQGHLELVLPLGGPSHRIRVSAPGFVSKVIPFGPADQPPSKVQLERAPPSPTPGVGSSIATTSKQTEEARSGTLKTEAKPVRSTRKAPSPSVAQSPELLAPSTIGTPKASRPPKAIRADEGVGEPAKPSETPAAAKHGANNSLLIR